MKRIILPYGGVVGAVIIGSSILTHTLAEAGSAAGSEWLGYLIMFVVLSLIFVGIKRYRDIELGGVIRFGTAVMLGLGITVVASFVYVGVWEAFLWMTDYTFIESYTSAILAAKEAQGLSAAALQDAIESMETLTNRYANPAFRLPMTFLEIFPVGLLITLASAGLLRNSRILPRA